MEQCVFKDIPVDGLFVFAYEVDLMTKKSNKNLNLKKHLPILCKYIKTGEQSYKAHSILLNNTEKVKRASPKIKGYTHIETPVFRF